MTCEVAWRMTPMTTQICTYCHVLLRSHPCPVCNPHESFLPFERKGELFVNSISVGVIKMPPCYRIHWSRGVPISGSISAFYKLFTQWKAKNWRNRLNESYLTMIGIDRGTTLNRHVKNEYVEVIQYHWMKVYVKYIFVLVRSSAHKTLNRIWRHSFYLNIAQERPFQSIMKPSVAALLLVLGSAVSAEVSTKRSCGVRSCPYVFLHHHRRSTVPQF